MIAIEFVSAESIRLAEDISAIVLTGVDGEGQDHQWIMPAEAVTDLVSVINGEASQDNATSSPPEKSAKQESKRRDQRRAERHPYRCTQLVAPCSDDVVPKVDSFREVVCNDLSATGFSFFSPAKPDFEKLVIMLLSGSEPTYLAAEVVHSREGYWERTRQFLVGCKFIGRLS